ncbi:MAG: hypothetical protein HY978_02080 [Candidatus Liptonbacteria bacterium]|nr:hypothetical protein [Candidatus Liptonbacteria bacterium]
MIMPAPIRSKEYYWTFHARNKMRQYQLSEQRVRRVLHSPARIEEGIAPNTIAAMQVVPAPKRPYEIWVMLQSVSRKSEVKGQKSKVKGHESKIISAWRYPGRTKPGDPIPAEILRELRMLA